VKNLIVYESQGKVDEKTAHLFVLAAKKGLTTPRFFQFFLANHQKTNEIEEFISAIKNLYFTIFPNKEIDEVFLTERFKEKEMVYEIIYFLFKPVNMDLETFKSYFGQVPECVDHIRQQGLVFQGPNWNMIESCYEFHQESLAIDIYPSKNRASFFAKASSGICTGIDIALFQRPDHFHLNLVDHYENQIVGNIQLYVLKDADKRRMLIRGINPALHFITKDSVGFLLDCVLKTAIQIAENSEIDEVCLCPSLGIWHVESSRKEMIAALRILSPYLPVVQFGSPFLLFHFAKQDKFIHFCYKVWSKKEGSFLPHFFSSKQSVTSEAGCI
jgi:hypothetical protein